MIAAGIANRTPARPFINCESPRFWPVAKFVYNTRTPREQCNSKREVPQYHWCRAMKHKRFTHHSEWPARAVRVATYALLAGALCASAGARAKKSSRPGRVQTGLDVLEAQKVAPLRNKHIGLI